MYYVLYFLDHTLYYDLHITNLYHVYVIDHVSCFTILIGIGY